MTIQSLAWAIDQSVPGEAKLVLMALANYADHNTGECRFENGPVAREASVPEASLPRYLGALRRNGYLARVDAKEGRRYWLQFDRDGSRPWSWDAEADESQTVERRTALVGGVAPSTFARDRQAGARDAIAAEQAQKAAQGVPVIDGSDAYKAWCNHFRARRMVIPFVHSIVLASGQTRRGFYQPTLFPPRAEESAA